MSSGILFLVSVALIFYCSIGVMIAGWRIEVEEEIHKEMLEDSEIFSDKEKSFIAFIYAFTWPVIMWW